jgi:hypothetical protein
MCAIRVSRERAVDIDEEYDFIVAEAIAARHDYSPPVRCKSIGDANRDRDRG